jgi:prepilin peptidase CpaA
MTASTLIFAACVVAYTASAAVVDARLRRIPNLLTVPAALAGLLYHTLSPSGWGAATSLAGLAVGFRLLLVPWLLGGGGAGDVKLLSALGAWLGPIQILVAFVLAVASAALLAVIVLAASAARQGLAKTQARLRPTTAPGARRRVLPFAVPVAASAWAVVAWLVASGRI